MDCQHTLPNDKGCCMRCGDKLITNLSDKYYENIKQKKSQRREGFYMDDLYD